MDALFDRLGLYDFFNVLLAGGIVLFYCLVAVFYLDKQLFGDVKESWILNVGLLLTTFLIGILCQEIGRVLTETVLKIKDRQIGAFLREKNRIIHNECKVRAYRRYASDILKQAGETDITYNPEQSKYVFSHCIYYIENRGKNKKVEKMRALYGMAQNLVGAAVCIFLCGILFSVKFSQEPDEAFAICTLLGSGVLSCFGLMRVTLYNRQMICMTMGVYEACLGNNIFGKI